MFGGYDSGHVLKEDILFWIGYLYQEPVELPPHPNTLTPPESPQKILGRVG